MGCRSGTAGGILPKAVLALAKKVRPEPTLEKCDWRVVANAFDIQEYALTHKEPVTWMKLATQEMELR